MASNSGGPLTLLNQLLGAIEKGDLDDVRKHVNLLHNLLSTHKDLLAELHRNGAIQETQTDLIITACVHKQDVVLYYLLHETDILDYMPETSLSEDLVNCKRKRALCYAICSKNFNMIEMLYDYWCGDAHWSGQNNAQYVISSIQRLGDLFAEASAKCQDVVKKDRRLYVQIHCLIKFNEFQNKLYAIIHDLKSKTDRSGTKNPAKAVGTMLLKVLRAYDWYSNLGVVRIPTSDANIEELIKYYLRDPHSLYYKGMAYIMYEVYFRKLDFNVSLLILENLNVLQNRLRKRFNVRNKTETTLKASYTRLALLYNEIECILYHFIYRTGEDWRLYLPADRQLSSKNNRLCYKDGQIFYSDLKYDEHKIKNSPVLLLERKCFKKKMKHLKRILKKHVISKLPALQKNETVKEELLDYNYLKQMSYLRDNYSLKKIKHYISVVINSNDSDVLMVERTLQVIGEMMKSSEKSHHVSKITKALLEMELSGPILLCLHNIRLYLSKVHEGQLSRRISVATGHEQTFNKVQEDLKKIIKIVDRILEIYKYILDKTLLDKGLHLLDQRLLKLPDTARQRIDEIRDLYNQYGCDFEDHYMQTVWRHTGLSQQLLTEISIICENEHELLQKRQHTVNYITDLAVAILPRYIDHIKLNIINITDNNKIIKTIKDDLTGYKVKELPDHPKKAQINDIYGKLESHMRDKKCVDDDLLKRFKEIKDLTTDWACIIYVLNFFINEIYLLQNHALNFELNVKNKQPNGDTLDTVNIILQDMEQLVPSNQYNSVQSHTFDGITELDENVYIKDPLGKTRDKLISCLIDRVDLLTDLLEYPNTSLNQNLLRCKRDPKFHVVIEMVLADIGNVLANCKIYLMNKSDKLLAGIDLSNVLDHGNPFLEVISDIFDSRDFSTALLTKARMFAKDGNAIKALHKLFLDNISYTTIEYNVRHGMSNDQIDSLDTFRMSDNWKDYLKLISRS